MNIRLSKQRRESGSALLVTIAVAAIMGMTLASYMTLVQAQNRAVAWSQTWNSALPVAEAGIEDALTHLNYVKDGSRATNGWTASGNYFVREATFSGGTYVVAIDNATPPSITSTGRVTLALTGKQVERVVRVGTVRLRTGMRGMLAKGDITMNGNCAADSFDSQDPEYSTGGIYDEAKAKDGSFVGSVYGNVATGGGTIAGEVATGATGAASGNVGDFEWLKSSSGIQPGHYTSDLNVDFPSVTAPTGGYTPTGATVTTTNYTYTQTIVTTNVYPNPAPASGVTTITTNLTSTTHPGAGYTVTTNWVSTSQKNTKPAEGTYMPGTLTEVVVTSPPPKKGTYYYFDKITGYTWQTTAYQYTMTTAEPEVTTATYENVLGNGSYQMDSFKATKATDMIVTGDAVLYVKGDFAISGNGQVTIAPGASLTLYVGGGVQIAGNGVVNQNFDATKMVLYGLDSCTDIKMTGNAAWTGIIYAPQAEMQLGGGGSDGMDIVGATVTKTVKMNGHYKFHYDENLGRVGGFTRWNVASWSEM
ncbi:MAG TPA: hypothetical protein VEH27_04785 [Methylomirabilota bacterium]|nr:hypothetical protein [Methylomirabilota bacterium]